MKRWLTLFVVMMIIFGLAGCAQAGGTNSLADAQPEPASTTPAAAEGDDAAAGEPQVWLGVGIGQAQRRADISFENLKLGYLYVDDLSDTGWTTNQYNGVEKMRENLGIAEDQIIHKFNTPEDAECVTAIDSLVEEGCDVIFGTAYGHGIYMLEAAEKYPNVEFCHTTGHDAVAAMLPNFHNYFPDAKQPEYVAGVLAGMATKSNQIGYVAQFPYGEMWTNITATALGAQSVNPDAVIKVMFINSWYDPIMEDQCTVALLNGGCDVMMSHSAVAGPAVSAENAGALYIGLGGDIRDVVPGAVLASKMYDWSVYYSLVATCMAEGKDIPLDWQEGYESDSVYVTPLNEALAPQGAAEKMAEAVEWLRSNNVLSGPIYDPQGNLILAEGEQHIEPTSAFTWEHVIRGVEVIS